MINVNVSADTTLLEALMQSGGFPTNTRARKAIKGGFVTVNGEVNRIPSSQLKAGTEVIWRPTEAPAQAPRRAVVDFQLGGASKTALNVPSPFEIVFEDDALLAYIKPAGWVFASPNPKVKTAYTRMKEWMEQARPECTDVHFVNRIEKESSGICFIAKDLQWRVHMQKHWATYQRGLYVLVEGHLPADDEVFAYKELEGKKKKDRIAYPYRTMRATAAHTLLKFEVGFDSIPDLMSGLRRAQCLVIGKGESAPNPLDRSGLHLYHVVVEGPEGQRVEAKTRVPREFLNLMKGGKGPRARSASELEAVRQRKDQPTEGRNATRGRLDRAERDAEGRGHQSERRNDRNRPGPAGERGRRLDAVREERADRRPARREEFGRSERPRSDERQPQSRKEFDRSDRRPDRPDRPHSDARESKPRDEFNRSERRTVHPDRPQSTDRKPRGNEAKGREPRKGKGPGQDVAPRRFS